MPDRVSRALRISTGGLVFSGYLALVSVRTYPVLLALIPLVMVLLGPVGERLDRQHGWYRTITTACNIAACCFIPLLLVTMGRLNAVLALVMYIQFYLMLHQKRPRDYYYIFLMSFFLILGGCFQAPEPVIALVLLLTITSAAWGFIALRAHTDALMSAGAVPADIVPLHSDHRAPRPEAHNPFDLSFVGWVMGVVVVCVGVTGFIFVATPRIEAGVLGRTNTIASTTGLSQQVDLRGGNFVQEDPTPVMRVVFPDMPEGRYTYGPLYWRATTMARFNGSRWSRKPLERPWEPGISEVFPRDLHEITSSANPLKASRAKRQGMPAVHHEIYLTDNSSNQLPAMDLVQFVSLNTSPGTAKVHWDGFWDFTLEYNVNRSTPLSYDVWSEVKQYPIEEIEAVLPGYEFMNREDYEVLTAHTLLPETQALAGQVTGDAEGVFAKSMAIRDYLSGPDFTYTMSIPAMNRDFVIDDFINRVRAGHCEFFASAMALMLRSQGIPTRVVSGYRGGEWSETDGAYIVRKSMAHLWVEVLFPELGWIRFDPAPREDYTPPTGIQAFINSVQRTALNLQVFWFQEVVGFDRGLTLDRLRNVSLRLFGREGDQESDEVVPGEPSGPPAPYYLRTIPAPLFIFGWLALMTGLVWSLLRRRKQAAGLSPDQQRASKLYRQLVRRLERLGIPHETRTAEELIEAIADYPVVDPREGAELVAIYNEVRFGGRRLTAERFTELRRRIRAIDAT